MQRTMSGIFITLVVLALSSPSYGWSMTKGWQLHNAGGWAEAATLAFSPASESNIWNFSSVRAQVAMYLGPLRLVTESDTKVCLRNSAVDIVCLAIARDSTLDAGCQFCGSGLAEMNKAPNYNAIDLRIWGEICAIYTPPGPPGGGGGTSDP